MNHWLLTGMFFCGLAAFQPAWAQTYPRVWQQVFPSSNPPQNFDFAMAYDEARQVVVLFGGFSTDTSGYYAGTWTWDGQTWSLVTLLGPGLLSRAKMVYDSQRQVCVLFGGMALSDGNAVSETWEWDGAIWQLRTTNGPPPTVDHAMAYDKARQRTVLYGGSSCRALCGSYSAYTWEWDGQQWLRVSTNGPPRRVSSAMAYDEARQRIVLFGGYDPGVNTYYHDTWTWDGVVWLQMLATGPVARVDHAMTYDPDRRTVLLFGGWDVAETRDNSTWEWDGSQWFRHTPSVSPLWRAGHGLTYDAARNEIVLYGGATAGSGVIWYSLHDTWLLRLAETWVDFNYLGLPNSPETGDFISPYNTLAEGVTAAPAGSVLSMKAGTGQELITITKPLKLRAPLGPVTIGGP